MIFSFIHFDWISFFLGAAIMGLPLGMLIETEINRLAHKSAIYYRRSHRGKK